MENHAVADFIFKELHPHLIASLTLLLAWIYMLKYLCIKEGFARIRRPIYLLRAFLWLMFTIIWAAYPYMNLIEARAMLRAMFGIIVLVEIAYNIIYIRDAFRETWQWIYRFSRTQQ